jgi:F420-dependent oxidoreductase-like protein
MERTAIMEFGLHISDFTWRTGAPRLGSTLAALVRHAEASGIARITLVDHLWQPPALGPVENAMLEAYATLGFIVAHTEKVRLHTLVSGVLYREPALLAKMVTTLDVLSGGRVGLGIGAGWNGQEASGMGFAFPPVAERMRRLEEAIQICLQMWSDSDAPYDGEFYRLGRSLNSPQSIARPHPFLMIGGSGEKQTLRMVAQYADACNIGFNPESARKLEVLRSHCDAVGRDYDDIEKTAIIPITPESTSQSLAVTARGIAALGFTTTYVFAVDMPDPTQVVDVIAGARALQT